MYVTYINCAGSKISNHNPVSKSLIRNILYDSTTNVRLVSGFINKLYYSLNKF